MCLPFSPSYSVQPRKPGGTCLYNIDSFQFSNLCFIPPGKTEWQKWTNSLVAIQALCHHLLCILYTVSLILFHRIFVLQHQFCSITQSCPTLCDPMNCSTPGLPVHHQLPESTKTHVHWVGDAIQPSYPLSSPSPPAHNPSNHPCLFQSVSSSHEVAKVLEFQLQHQSFQWTPRTYLL